MQKNINKLYERIDQELSEIVFKYGLNPNVELEQAIHFLSGIADMSGISFVSGKGKRKTELQRDREKLTEYRERIEKYKEILGICGKRKSYSKTDTDATFMRMKEDHMQNGQLKPGCNVQIGVESEYIIGVGLFPNPTDTTTLIPFLERVQNGCGHKYRNIIADSGCSHREQCFKGQYENRKISLSQTMVRQKREATERITTDEGIVLRMNRSIQVEGAFGVLKEDYAFRRFLTRGKRKTETQFFLLCFAYNIQKLWNRSNSGRLGKPLFEKIVA